MTTPSLTNHSSPGESPNSSIPVLNLVFDQKKNTPPCPDLPARTPRRMSSEFSPTSPTKTSRRSSLTDSFGSPRGNFAGMRVLYVEDSPLFHLLMQNAAKHLRWDLTIARTGQAAIQLVKLIKYDVVLMDIQLGTKSISNGYQTAEKMKDLDPSTLIISFSSNSMEGKQSFGNKFDGHIAKKVTPKFLSQSLEPYIIERMRLRLRSKLGKGV